LIKKAKNVAMSNILSVEREKEKSRLIRDFSDIKMPNVKVLLNEKIDDLGEIGQIVSVKPGYARNYLLPKNLATIPTLGEVRRMQKKKEQLEKLYQEEKAKAEELAKKITALSELKIIGHAGDAGKLFGSITAKDIAEKLSSELDAEISRKQILLKRSISDLGEYNIKLKLHNEVSAEIKVIVKKEE